MRIDLVLSRRTHVAPSPRVLRVAGMFGLGVDEERTFAVVPPVSLDLSAGQIVFVTGASGSGKSTILNLIADALQNSHDACVLRFDDLPALPDLPLVECLSPSPPGDDESDEALTAVLRWLSLAGLNDAFVMLRRPSELSDGQRYRLRVAQVMSMIESPAPGDRPAPALTVVLADEFAATLDRITAATLARNVRKWVTRSAAPLCFIAATTHDDLLEALEPDVLLVKHLGSELEVLTR